MPEQHRSELQQEVVDALLESSAINFEAIGGLFSKFGERAARSGIDIGLIVGRRVINYCIPPDPYSVIERGRAGSQPG